MHKYRGTYRVVCEVCQNTLEPEKDDVFIYCSNDGQIFRVNKNTLAYYRVNGIISSIMLSKLTAANVEFENRSNGEALLYFNEKDIHIVAEIVGARTSGAGFNPASKKNLRLFKWFRDNEEKYRSQGLLDSNRREMSEEEKQVVRDRLQSYRDNKVKK